MLRLNVSPRETPNDDALTCPVCKQPAKLNELVRSAHHVLGCHNCYCRPAVMVTRKLAS